MPDLMSLFARLKRGGIARTFRHRDFAIWSVASWFSDNGMWMMRIGMGWLTWELTHSGAWLGTMVLAQALPSVFLVPFAGAMADRMDRVKILRSTQVVSVMLAFGISFMTWSGWVNVYVLLAYALTHGMVATIATPARVTIGPNLVPRADISAAIAVSSVLFGSATFLGPALAGVLINQVGIAFAFVGFGAANIVLVIALGLVKIEREERHVSQGSVIDDVVEGVRYVAKHPGILPTLALAVGSALLVRPLQDLMPGFADTVFGRGAAGLATLMAAMGVGGMVGSLWIANRNRLSGTASIYLWSSLAYALGTLAFAASSHFIGAIAIMVLTGAAMSIANNTSQILIQNAVAGTMRARVMSLYSYNYRTLPALGALVMGWAANIVGFQVPVGAAAVLTIAMVAWTFRYRGAMRASLEIVIEEEPQPMADSAVRKAAAE